MYVCMYVYTYIYIYDTYYVVCTIYWILCTLDILDDIQWRHKIHTHKSKPVFEVLYLEKWCGSEVCKMTVTGSEEALVGDSIRAF